MEYSINSLFDTLLPWIPEELVGRDVISGIRRLNELMPPDLAMIGGMECRLGTDDRKADWFLGVNALGGGKEVLARCLADENLPPFFRENPAWKDVRNFATQWANPDSPLYNHISFMWLEFDYTTIESGIPAPSVFLQAVGKAEESGEGRKNYDWLFKEVLGCFPDAPVDEEIREKVRFCLENLPEDAHDVYAALMIGRKVSGLRLVLSIPHAKLEAYLSRIGWEGSSAELMDVIENVSKIVDLVDINLDVSHRVHSKIGLECILRKKQLQIEPRWKDLINFLVERSLCKPDKARWLLSWPGHELVTLPHESQPSYVFRGISHVKIDYRTGCPLEAKGYLGFRKIYQSDVEKMVQ